MRFALPLFVTLLIPALSWAQGCIGQPRPYRGAGCYGASAGCQGYTAGTGCVGTRSSYGCQGYSAGCVGTRQTYGGCRGSGCVGATGGQMGFPPSTVRYERYEKYEGPAAFAPPPRAYGAAAYYAPPPRYGAKVAPGVYETPTTRKAPPEVFGTTGEYHPILNNELHAAARSLFGFDHGRYEPAPETLPPPRRYYRRR